MKVIDILSLNVQEEEVVALPGPNRSVNDSSYIVVLNDSIAKKMLVNLFLKVLYWTYIFNRAVLVCTA